MIALLGYKLILCDNAHCFAGTDFDVLEEHYEFNNETTEQAVHIVVYDDLILEEEEYFLLYIPTLSTNNDVLLVTETSPNSVRVIIHDDEGNEICFRHYTFHIENVQLFILCAAVAQVGFKTDGDIMLQEGGGSARVCAGFDSDVDTKTIDSKVFFILKVTDLSALNPGSGHGTYTSFNPECIKLGISLQI